MKDKLVSAVKAIFSTCEVTFDFIGAGGLLELAQHQPSSSLNLDLAASPVYTDSQGYICLVNLKAFFDFITDDNDQSRRRNLEANVRDFAGDTEVNKGIKDTLENGGTEDFWWLNNGITIVAAKISQAGQTLTLGDPQIVNGLQTSVSIFNHFKKNPGASETRNLLIRIVVPVDEDSRDRIIKSTNSQTTIPVASLRATEKIHQTIEMYFAPNGLFYDRRKNFHKNAGKPKDLIIGIPYLAQAMMAIVLSEPDNARARPSTLIKNDDDHNRVFDPEYPIELFLRSANFMMTIDEFLRKNIDQNDDYGRNNLKFHLAMFATARKVGKWDYQPKDTFKIKMEQVDEEFLEDCLEHVRDIFETECEPPGEDVYWNPDSVAKSRELVAALKARVREII